MFVYISIEFNERRKGNIRRLDQPTLLKLSENGMNEVVCSNTFAQKIIQKRFVQKISCIIE
jgi:hypothetical protein